MKAEDLISTFSDIWYPSSDDLDIIDGTMQWIVSIDHNGTVRALSVGKMK